MTFLTVIKYMWNAFAWKNMISKYFLFVAVIKFTYKMSKKWVILCQQNEPP